MTPSTPRAPSRPPFSTLIRVAALAAGLLAASLSAGCQSVAFQCVDRQSHQPIKDCLVVRSEEHGTLMQFLMMLPPGEREADRQVSDQNGMVRFRSVHDSDRYSFSTAGTEEGVVESATGEAIYNAPHSPLDVSLKREGNFWVVPLPQ